MMSNKYAKVKKYYENGLWSLRQVGDAAKRGWVSVEEYEEITGEVYEGEVDNSGTIVGRVEDLEALIVMIAEIEVTAGNLELEDIPGNLQNEVRVKLEDDKWIDR